MGAKIISITDARKKEKHDAFVWAMSEQERLGCIAEPLSLNFERDDMDCDKDGCVISIFQDDDTGKVVLRRDWMSDMGVKYDLIVNFPEIKKRAPRSVNFMLENAIKLYRYYDGPNGGVTRKVDHCW
ncbi:hypothetical protein IKF43_01540 [Candidatus Saccharibacteria bacterium]|nr:hypothetical protein [Candidatus Saccharibacteria bacterium]